MASSFSQFIIKIRGRARDARTWLKHRILVALVWALLFSLVPWAPPSFAPAVDQAFENAPQAVRWAEPLALGITGWTDQALSLLMGPTPVYAGTNITLTLSKRDDGPDVGTRSAGPDPVGVGETVLYFIHITNTGSITATVFLTEILPSELSYEGSGVTSQNGGALWFDGPLAGNTGALFFTGDFVGTGSGLGPGKSAVLWIEARVQQGLTNGYIITNDQYDYYAVATQEPGFVYDGLNDVDTTVRSPQLSIAKTADPITVGVGALLTYTIVYTNNGAVGATGIVVTDTLDPDVTYVSATPLPDTIGPVIVWDTALGDLAPGASGQIELVVRVGSDLNNNDILVNQAEIGCDQNIYASTGDVETVVKALTVRVSKSATPPTVRAGERITYTIVFTNDSDIPITSKVYITDTLPAGMTNVTSDTVDATFNSQNGSAYSWFVDSMPEGSVGTIELAADAITSPVAANGSTTILNQLAITSTAANSAVPSSLSNVVIPAEADTVTILISPDEQIVGNASNIAITLVDQYGNLVYNGDNYTVDLTRSPNGPTFGTTPVSIVNGQGTSTINSNMAGTFVVTASVSGMPAISNTALVTFTSGIVHHYVIGPIADHQAGVNFTVDITAEDQFNNTVSGFNDTVDIADNTTPNTLRPSTVSFSGGIVSGEIVSITLARANTAIVVGTSPSSNSNPFTITAAAPNTVTVATGQVNIPVGINELATATVVDVYNNPVDTGTVAFSISLIGTVNPVNSPLDAMGQATSNVSSTVTGPATIEVTAAGGIVGSTNITFVAGCPYTVSVVVNPDIVQVGNPAVVTVDVEDQYGNKVDWASVTFDAAGLGAGGIVPATAALDSNGMATAILTSTLVGQKTVIVDTVAARGCSSVSGQAWVTYTIGAASQVTITMDPNPQEVSVNANLIALAADQYGNPVAGEVITFAAFMAGLGGGGISALTGTTDASGEATVQISSTLIGGVAVTATLQSDPAVFGTNVVSFTSGPPRFITVTVNPANVENNVQATLTVTMTDAFGNPCAWQPVTFTVTGYTGAVFDPSRFVNANANGVATTRVSGPVLGTMTISAQGNSPYSDTTTLHVVAGPLEDFETNFLADVEAGINFTLHITAVDALGQHRAENGTILLVDGTGTLQPDTVTMLGGYATVVLSITQAMVDDWIRLIWQPDTDIFATTNLFTVMPGAPMTVALQYESQMASCVNQPITATVQDRFENPVPSQVVTFSIASGIFVLVPPTTLTADANGQAVVYARSTQSGTASIHAEIAGGIIATAYITFGIGAPGAITLTASALTVQAGNSIALTATVEDCGGHPISNLGMASEFVAHLSTGAGVVTPTSGTTDKTGQYTFGFTGTQTGQAYLVVSYIDRGRIETEQIIITVIPGEPATVTLTADPTAIVPEGHHSILSAVVRDAYGNIVPGCGIVFERVSGPSVTFDPITRTATTDINGTASITLTSTEEEGVVQIRAFPLLPIYDFEDTISVTIRWFAVYMPLVLKNYPRGDLEVTQITSHKYKKPGEDQTRYEVRVTILNNGPDTISGFWVDLYLDPREPIATNVLWHQVSRMGKAWYVTEPLAPGATMVLSTNAPDSAPPGVPVRVYSNWPGYLVGSPPHELWAM
ncbi:MAG: Ig-like domain-containing protein, partial [Anaerolineae bacterium]|nr:Ig-like domain-containing protein [Anaerolineae bacterium]